MTVEIPIQNNIQWQVALQTDLVCDLSRDPDPEQHSVGSRWLSRQAWCVTSVEIPIQNNIQWDRGGSPDRPGV